MPGRNDISCKRGRFTPAWAAYRKGLDSVDDTGTDLDISSLPTINLATTRHIAGANNFILLHLRDDAQASTLTLVLYLKNDGDLYDVLPFSVERQVTGVAHGSLIAFTGLRAGEYRIAIDDVAGGALWDLYYTEGTGELPVKASQFSPVVIPPFVEPFGNLTDDVGNLFALETGELLVL